MACAYRFVVVFLAISTAHERTLGDDRPNEACGGADSDRQRDHELNRVPHMLTADSGWTITADGVDVELTGQVCSDAMSGRFSRITFEYACKSGDGPPPPPFITPS